MKAKDLCKCFKNIMPNIYWITYSDESNITQKIRVMPHFLIKNERQRINNCPQCGLYVRSIELNENEYKELSK
ncbi:MAG: hypothetical protein ACOYLT_07470 [Flavobacterium sp.]|uniref:hypothetical protein n=1 Tax=Flavobacterium sp. TaxID=239 RepID=UPI003BC4DD10